MLDRQLTEDEEAPYQKLYRLPAPENSSPPIPRSPSEDTVQSMFAGTGEVLVSFDPGVLDWYPSVVIPLPHNELFEYLLSELVDELSHASEDDIVRVAGALNQGETVVWTEQTAETSVEVATYATTSNRRLTLDIPLPSKPNGETEVASWLRTYSALRSSR